jgi:hypothetical protein
MLIELKDQFGDPDLGRFFFNITVAAMTTEMTAASAREVCEGHIMKSAPTALSILPGVTARPDRAACDWRNV